MTNKKGNKTETKKKYEVENNSSQKGTNCVTSINKKCVVQELGRLTMVQECLPPLEIDSTFEGRGPTGKNFERTESLLIMSVEKFRILMHYY